MNSKRVISAGFGGAAAAIVAAAGGASWFYARRLVEPAADAAPSRPGPADIAHIVAVEGNLVHLQGPDVARRGTWGLAWDGGYAQIGPVVDVTDDYVVRSWIALPDTPPVGTAAYLDGDAYPDDPGILGVPFEHTTYHSSVGELPAWFFPGEGDTWAIFVHGRSANRHESFRALPTFLAREIPSLVISYRNDVGAPRSPDGRCHLGWSEWEDVEGAVVHAVANGATKVVLVGFSMGGACVVNFLRMSGHADRVSGLVLEAPVLDWGPVIKRAAVQRGLPPAVLPMLVPTSMALARLQAGIDWNAMKVQNPDVLTTPTLLIHGDADPLVPVELADAFAAQRSDLITYLRVPGAAHVRGWNADRTAYESAVAVYLDGVLDKSVKTRRKRRK